MLSISFNINASNLLITSSSLVFNKFLISLSFDNPFRKYISPSNSSRKLSRQ